MIVGFPGETVEDFEATLSLTAAAQYHSMFSFKYSPRPNTLAAARMVDDVSEAEKTRRIVALQTLQRDIQTGLHQSAVGSVVEVLVDSVSRRQSGSLRPHGGEHGMNVALPADTAGQGTEVWLGRRSRCRCVGPGRTAWRVTH